MLVRTGLYRGANEQERRDYIDRNITLCEEWKSFETFRDWSDTHGFAAGLQIDRIDNDKGYCPDNCRWVSPKVNMNNRRNTLRLEDGTPLAVFCSKVGIETRGENSEPSKQYGRIRDAYRRHHKIHPELIKKASDLIALYRRCLEMLKLLDEVRQLKQTLNKP